MTVVAFQMLMITQILQYLYKMFSQLNFSASGYSRKNQNVARPEQEERGGPLGPLLPLHPLRPALVAGDPAQGGHVQIKTQTRLCFRFVGSTVRFCDDCCDDCVTNV